MAMCARLCAAKLARFRTYNAVNAIQWTVWRSMFLLHIPTIPFITIDMCVCVLYTYTKHAFLFICRQHSHTAYSIQNTRMPAARYRIGCHPHNTCTNVPIWFACLTIVFRTSATASTIPIFPFFLLPPLPPSLPFPLAFVSIFAYDSRLVECANFDLECRIFPSKHHRHTDSRAHMNVCVCGYFYLNALFEFSMTFWHTYTYTCMVPIARRKKIHIYNSVKQQKQQLPCLYLWQRHQKSSAFTKPANQATNSKSLLFRHTCIWILLVLFWNFYE